jgi:hypothetical protein
MSNQRILINYDAHETELLAFVKNIIELAL